MLDKMIINDFLNHFYLPSQLSVFINIPLEEIERVLSDEEIVTSILGKDGMNKINKHMLRIQDWIYSSSEELPVIKSDIDERIVEIANYIVINKSSIRSAAEHFKLSKSTIHDYIEGRLPSISIILYKNVFDVLKANKSLSATESMANYDLIYYEYDLLMSGRTIDEISKIIGISRQKVQRDLGDRIGTVDSDLGIKSKIKLFSNQMTPLYQHQFKSTGTK